MRLLIAGIAFAVTIGFLTWAETDIKLPEVDHNHTAQEQLVNSPETSSKKAVAAPSEHTYTYKFRRATPESTVTNQVAQTYSTDTSPALDISEPTLTPNASALLPIMTPTTTFNQPTPSAPPQYPTTTATATPSTSHTYYTSSYHSSKYYYCNTDDAWKTLSTKYVKSFTSETDLLAAYPNKTLHEPCKQ